MPTISSTIKMMDGMSGPLKSIMNSMNLMIRAFEQMQNVTERNTNVDRLLAASQREIASATAEINRQIEQADKAQKQFNQSLKLGESGAGGLLRSIKGIAATYFSLQGIRAVANISDEYVNSLARLNLINDGLQTTAQLQDKIFAAANRARGSYTDMAGVIGRMGVLAGKVFSSNDELIAFTELMQKAFRVGGASTIEQQSAMYQLSQAMAAGRLQGDEFRTIMEAAPRLAQAIADVTGKSMGDLKTMSAEGVITADIIKAAMFNAADDINKKFATMPMTFGDVMNQLKNSALQAFGPAIQQISRMLNDPKMASGIEGVGKAMAAAAVAAVWLLNVVGDIFNFITSNWPTIEPIVWGIVGAFGAWFFITKLQAISQGLLAIRTAAVTAAVFYLTFATEGLTAAWATLNAVQKANVFVLLISAIVALAMWLINLWNTNDQFAAGLMRTWNTILNFFDQVPIFFDKVGKGIFEALAWVDLEIVKLVDSMTNTVIDGINWMIEQLNKIPGVSLETIGHVSYAAKEALALEARRQAMDKNLAEKISSAAAKAAEREQKVKDFLANRAAERAKQVAEKQAAQAKGYDFSKWQTKPDIGKVDEVGKIRDTVDISSEDLKMMRELAEMKSIQNFVSLTPTVTVHTGPVNKKSDIDEIIARIERSLTEQIASSARGVYGLG
ncbi:tape measure protein [Thermicanus aegyptius]|uniref:tape measure protein n=1 Tax=Thermicanus aegyptius TaxID=94009 RepID=UPI00048CC475|nr:tape measure protein [Thermicanus aegyptius]